MTRPAGRLVRTLLAAALVGTAGGTVVVAGRPADPPGKPAAPVGRLPTATEAEVRAVLARPAPDVPAGTTLGGLFDQLYADHGLVARVDLVAFGRVRAVTDELPAGTYS